MPVGVFFFFLHLCAERDDNQASWTRTAATVLLNIPLSLPQTCRFSLSDGVKVYVSGFSRVGRRAGESRSCSGSHTEWLAGALRSTEGHFSLYAISAIRFGCKVFHLSERKKPNRLRRSSLTKHFNWIFKR